MKAIYSEHNLSHEDATEKLRANVYNYYSNCYVDRKDGKWVINKSQLKEGEPPPDKQRRPGPEFWRELGLDE